MEIIISDGHMLGGMLPPGKILKKCANLVRLGAYFVVKFFFYIVISLYRTRLIK